MRFIRFLKRMFAWKGIIAGLVGLGTTFGMLWGYGLHVKGGGVEKFSMMENPYSGLIILSIVVTFLSLMVAIFLLEANKVSNKHYENQRHWPLDKLTEKVISGRAWTTRKKFWFTLLQFSLSVAGTILLVIVTSLYVKNNGGYDYFSKSHMIKYYVVVLIPLYFQVILFMIKWSFKLFFGKRKDKKLLKKAEKLNNEK